MSSASARRPSSSAAEADQAEVADEAAVVAAEAVEEEGGDRPGAELALAQEPRWLPPRAATVEQALEIEHAARCGRAPRRGASARPLAAICGGREAGEAGAVGRERQAGVRRRPRAARSRARCGAPRANVTSWPASPRHERVQAGARARRRADRGRAPPGRPAGRRARPARGTARCRRRRASRKRRRSSAQPLVGRGERDLRARRRLRCATRACAGPAGVAKTSSAPSSRSRSVPSRTPPSVIAQVVGPARPQLDQRRHGTSSAAGGGASAKPGATSSSVAMRARRARRRASWSRGRPSAAATSSRGAAT